MKNASGDWECNYCGNIGENMDHMCLHVANVAVETNMVATEVPQAIVLLNAEWYYGELVLQTTCCSYDDYKALPPVVNYTGIDCGLTGWSSDTYTACYKSGAAIARVVSNKRA